jgi:hypothetical protein
MNSGRASGRRPTTASISCDGNQRKRGLAPKRARPALGVLPTCIAVLPNFRVARHTTDFAPHFGCNLNLRSWRAEGSRAASRRLGASGVQCSRDFARSCVWPRRSACRLPRWRRRRSPSIRRPSCRDHARADAHHHWLLRSFTGHPVADRDQSARGRFRPACEQCLAAEHDPVVRSLGAGNRGSAHAQHRGE